MTYTSNKTISEMTGYFYNVTFTLNTCQRVGVRLTQVGHIKLNIYFLAESQYGKIFTLFHPYHVTVIDLR